MCVEEMKSFLISTYLMSLDCFGKIGRVHSVFEHSFNFIVEGKLIHVTDARDYLSSFGIRMSPEDFQELRAFGKVGSVVKLTDVSLSIYDSQGIKKMTFGTIERVSLRLIPCRYDEKVLLHFMQQLEQYNLMEHLGIDIGQKEQVYFERMIRPKSCDQEWQELVNFFIGRGKGLTPSGDDLLLGYLFILKLFQVPEIEKLEFALSRSLSATTIVSQNYLQTLLEGFASLPLIELNRWLLNPEGKKLEQVIASILSFGHTSGKDTAFGMLLGVQRLLSKSIVFNNVS